MFIKAVSFYVPFFERLATKFPKSGNKDPQLDFWNNSTAV
jgi:hypothetical protein